MSLPRLNNCLCNACSFSGEHDYVQTVYAVALWPGYLPFDFAGGAVPKKYLSLLQEYTYPTGSGSSVTTIDPNYGDIISFNFTWPLDENVHNVNGNGSIDRTPIPNSIPQGFAFADRGRFVSEFKTATTLTTTYENVAVAQTLSNPYSIGQATASAIGMLGQVALLDPLAIYDVVTFGPQRMNFGYGFETPTAPDGLVNKLFVAYGERPLGIQINRVGTSLQFIPCANGAPGDRADFFHNQGIIDGFSATPTHTDGFSTHPIAVVAIKSAARVAKGIKQSLAGQWDPTTGIVTTDAAYAILSMPRGEYVFLPGDAPANGYKYFIPAP